MPILLRIIFNIWLFLKFKTPKFYAQWATTSSAEIAIHLWWCWVFFLSWYPSKSKSLRATWGVYYCICLDIEYNFLSNSHNFLIGDQNFGKNFKAEIFDHVLCTCGSRNMYVIFSLNVLRRELFVSCLVRFLRSWTFGLHATVGSGGQLHKPLINA